MRIRTIKPEFWGSPDVAQLDFFERLLFIGLWSMADDEGRLLADMNWIRSQLFPLDDHVGEDSVRTHGGLMEDSVSLHGVLIHLSNMGLITLYQVDNGRTYCQVTNFTTHQRINRPTESKIPPLTRGNILTHGGLMEDSLRTHGGLTEDSSQEQGTGIREQGSGKVIAQTDADATVLSDTPPTGNQLEVRGGGTPTRGGHRYTDEFEKFWKTYPRKVGKAEAAKAFTKLLKGGQVDADQLTAAAQAHAQAWQQSGTSQEFIPHASTWLNKGRWSDEPEVLNRTGDGRPTAGLSDDQWQQAWERAQILDADDDTQPPSPGWP